MVHWVAIPVSLFIGELIAIFAMALCRAGDNKRK